VRKSVTLTITPAVLLSMFAEPSEVLGGESSTGTVYLDGTAPAGGVAVSLSISSADASIPTSVEIPAGANSATFPISTVAVPKNQNITLAAKLGAVTKTFTLTIDRPALLSVTLSTNSVQGGQSCIGTVTIGSVAPVGGLVISLNSNIPAATVPATVTIPAGQTSATFTVQTTAVPSTTGATIFAALGNSLKSAVLAINP
jgi:hypothetical protein